jgi:hypothetical protein
MREGRFEGARVVRTQPGGKQRRGTKAKKAHKNDEEKKKKKKKKNPRLRFGLVKTRASDWCD